MTNQQVYQTPPQLHLAAHARRQIIGLKRDNARLREELGAYQHDFEDIMRAAEEYEWLGSMGLLDDRPGSALGGSRPGTAAAGSRPGTAAGRGGCRAAQRLSGTLAEPAQGGGEGAQEQGEAALRERLQRSAKAVQSLRRVAETERRRARQVGGSVGRGGGGGCRQSAVN
jgi:hypothetical protein